MDVFEHHYGVIDQSREGQRQTAQHHAVDGAAAELQRDHGGQSGNRNGEEDRDRGSHAAEENQDHEAGEEEPEPSLMEQRFDGRFDELRLVEDDLGDQRRRGIEQLGEPLADAVDNLNRIGIAALLEYGQIDGALAVDPHGVVLGGVGVFSDTDIGHADRGCANHFDRDIVNVGDVGDLAVGVNIVVVSAD